MRKLRKHEYDRAAAVFAAGFLEDPAFSLVLQGCEDANKLLETYFLNYINNCKELLLYKVSDAEEGYLCLYRHDAAFAEFDVPAPLEQLGQFQILDEYCGEDYAVLDIMAVAPESRGKGLAGVMIDYFVTYCGKYGLRALVEVFSAAHLDLYRAHGFEIAFHREHRGITTYILEYKQ